MPVTSWQQGFQLVGPDVPSSRVFTQPRIFLYRSGPNPFILCSLAPWSAQSCMTSSRLEPRGLKLAINTSVTATDEIYLRHIGPPKADLPTFDLPKLRRRLSEPALEPAGSEMSFLGDECLGCAVEGAHRFWAAQKVHVNLSDLAMAELHVARAIPVVSLR